MGLNKNQVGNLKTKSKTWNFFSLYYWLALVGIFWEEGGNKKERLRSKKKKKKKIFFTAKWLFSTQDNTRLYSCWILQFWFFKGHHNGLKVVECPVCNAETEKVIE